MSTFLAFLSFLADRVARVALLFIVVALIFGLFSPRGVDRRLYLSDPISTGIILRGPAE
jgi:hypothetical protein